MRRSREGPRRFVRRHVRRCVRQQAHAAGGRAHGRRRARRPFPPAPAHRRSLDRRERHLGLRRLCRGRLERRRCVPARALHGSHRAQPRRDLHVVAGSPARAPARVRAPSSSTRRRRAGSSVLRTTEEPTDTRRRREYPAAAMSEPHLRRTSLYDEHVALGGRIVPFAGWEMPVQYTGIVDEHKAVRTAAGMFDVSHMGELRLRGEYAAHVVDYLVTNDAKKLVDGQAMYTCCCNEAGHILDDLIVYRREEDDWLVVCNCQQPREDRRPLREGLQGPLRVPRRERGHRARRIPGPSRLRGAREAGHRGREPAHPQELPLPRGRGRRRSEHRGAYGLHGRGRGRDLLRVGGGAEALARSARGGKAAGREAGGPGRARHAPPRGATLALRQRHRRDHEPHRGGSGVGRQGGKR